MSKSKRDNTNFLISLFMSSVILLVAVLVWPKSNKIVQSNERNENETQIQITVKRINIRAKNLWKKTKGRKRERRKKKNRRR